MTWIHGRASQHWLIAVRHCRALQQCVTSVCVCVCLFVRDCVCVCVCVFPTGYSVLSATVPSGALYISGAPRYNLTGGVFVFDAANRKQRHLLQGEQVGHTLMNYV